MLVGSGPLCRGFPGCLVSGQVVSDLWCALSSVQKPGRCLRLVEAAPGHAGCPGGAQPRADCSLPAPPGSSLQADGQGNAAGEVVSGMAASPGTQSPSEVDSESNHEGFPDPSPCKPWRPTCWSEPCAAHLGTAWAWPVPCASSPSCSSSWSAPAMPR